jgi:hypothetical protein
MDGLRQLTAAPTTIEVRGGTRRLAPLSAGDYGAIERTVADLRDRKFRAGRATPSEIHAWLSEREGTAYALWLALLPFQREIPRSWCRELIDAATPAELERIRKKLDDGCGRSPQDTNGSDQTPGRDHGRERPIPWRRIFRCLSRTYGWTPREIADMTLAQICAYLDDAPRPGETARLPASEARAFARRKRADGASGFPGLSKAEPRKAPFDALMTLAARLRSIGQQLPEEAGGLHEAPAEQDDAAAAERYVPAQTGGWLARASNQMSFAPRGSDVHGSGQRQTEILARVDENLRRLRELVETRATAATALLADPP